MNRNSSFDSQQLMDFATQVLQLSFEHWQKEGTHIDPILGPLVGAEALVRILNAEIAKQSLSAVDDTPKSQA